MYMVYIYVYQDVFVMYMVHIYVYQNVYVMYYVCIWCISTSSGTCQIRFMVSKHQGLQILLYKKGGGGVIDRT